MRILGISLDTYGDQVLRQPLLSRLLDDGHEVTLAIRREYSDIVPYLDARLQALACDVTEDGLRPELRCERFDLVAALAFNRSELDNAILTGCRDVRRVALVDRDGPHADPRGRPREIDDIETIIEQPVAVTANSVERAKSEALYHAIAGTPQTLPRPRLRMPADTQARTDRLLAAFGLQRGSFVVMAGLRPATLKSMPFDLAVETIGWLAREHGLATLLTGVEFERDELAAVSAAAGGRSSVYIGRAGEIGELLALVAGARAYVGADTGTMHFAAALGLPVAALYAGGHFPRFEPDADRWFATTKRLMCFGCGWQCIYDEPRCIREVSSATWLSGVADLLAGASPGWRFESGSVDEASAASAMPEARTIIARYWRTAGEARGLAARVAELEMSTADNEADRAARLDVIERLDAANRALDASAQEARARIAAADANVETLTRNVHELQSRLNVVESDRAARLDVITKLDDEARIQRQAAEERLAKILTLQSELERATNAATTAATAHDRERNELLHRVEEEVTKGAHELQRAAEERADLRVRLERVVAENQRLQMPGGAFRALCAALRARLTRRR